MTLVTAEALRARCTELHALESQEPEDVYEQVADEFGIELQELFDLLGGE